MMGTAALILVVDDDPVMREITRVHLEGAGYRVALATSASDGLQKARALRPSVVVMDFAMPGGSGGEALRALRIDDEIGNTPVLMVTAWSLAESQSSASGLAATWLQKPVMGDRLIQSVRDLLPA
ncbi:response regulator [Brevundimonas halotolerans]|uniref:CheY-like chemotaxis protein n=1 Tax=Brevundimonas halotolerans TaxID=69670 RepID=A0A7W9A2T4_9CAUL|nr:response regulator [Brevundimonas halotolerans]MBB5660416.1 CheY-like chemotaxis protein [Brevundimonas halotolerans]